MLGNFIASPMSPMLARPLSPALTVPNSMTPFQNAQVQMNFYDPITGRSTGTANPMDRVTQYYNSGGISVEITGQSEHVKKAIGLLNVANDMQPSSFTDVLASGNIKDDEVYPIDMPIEEIMAKRGRPFTSTSSSIVNGKEWKLVPNPKNVSKYLLTSPNTTKPFSGSGLLIVEKNGGNPYVLLIKTSTRGTFEDLGGELDTKYGANQNTLKLNARKEAMEESQHLFVPEIDLERHIGGKPTYLDIDDPVNNAIYRCYILVLDGTTTYDIPNLYANNKIMLSNRNGFQQQDWRESVEMRRFSLQQIKNILDTTASGGINCNDISGISCTIRDRTANCLRGLIQRDFFNAMHNNPVTPKYLFDNNFMSATIKLHMFRI